MSDGTVNVEVPVSAIIEAMASAPRQITMDMGWNHKDGHQFLIVRNVSNGPDDQAIEFEARRAKEVRRCRVPVLDLFLCEEYKRNAALRGEEK